MPTTVRLEDVRRAREANDPELIRLVLTLAEQSTPQLATPVREGAPTFDLFLQTIRGGAFQRKSREEQRHFRVEQMKGVLPLLEEFMVSRGLSERAACLVAVTRIKHKYPGP